MTDRLLYISMLGTPDTYDVKAFTAICPSGLERDWISEWHGPAAAEFGLDLTAVDICRGERLPDADGVAAVILGGTFHSVAERRPWLQRAVAWLTGYRRTSRPLLGICGGHQLVAARIEDGELADRPAGVLMETAAVGLTPQGRAHPLFAGLPETPSFHFGNSQLIRPSPGQRGGILATQPSHPAAAIDHGDNWFSCQFHPEARKIEFDCYFASRDPAYESAYAATHDGPAVLTNFFRLAAAG